MFKFWRQRELHAKEVAICECAPQTSGLRDQSPVRDMEKKNNKKNKQKQKTNKQTNKQKKQVRAITLIIVTCIELAITKLTNEVCTSTILACTCTCTIIADKVKKRIVGSVLAACKESISCP